MSLAGGPAVPDTACVVVHHNNFPSVLDTVASVINSGILEKNLVVVDNSQDADQLKLLREALPREVEILDVSNRGYANAVNIGVSEIAKSRANIEYILVSTHEVILHGNALELLRKTLIETGAAVAGPTILAAGTGGDVWSLGGELSPFLNIPRHVRQGRSASMSRMNTFEERSWLDGALCLYSLSAIEVGLREDYILYFEETDLHSRLRTLGSRAIWVSGSTIEQHSRGIPPYLLARNLQIFQKTEGTKASQLLAVPYTIIRATIRSIFRREPLDFKSLMQGWIDGVNHVALAPGEQVPSETLDPVMQRLLIRTSTGTQ